MRIALAVIISVFILFILRQVWTFSAKNREIGSQVKQVAQELQKTKDDSHRLRADYEFYLNPVNLEKELRARFNFSLPGEKTIILVPKSTTTSQ